MKASILLADFAQTADGKLNVIGAGWNLIGPDPSPHAVAILLEVPWGDTNQPHHLVLELQDSDGNAARLGPSGETPRVDGQFELGRPAGHPNGEPLNVPLAFNFQPLPLTPGQRYVWVLTIDGQTDPTWRVGFNTRPNPGERARA